MDDRCYWIWLQSALGVQSRLEEAIAYFGTARACMRQASWNGSSRACLRLGSWKSCVPKG